MRRARFVINALALRPVYPRVSRRALRPRTNPKRRDAMERTLGKSADARPDVITFSLANAKEKVTKRKGLVGVKGFEHARASAQETARRLGDCVGRVGPQSR